MKLSLDDIESWTKKDPSAKFESSAAWHWADAITDYLEEIEGRKEEVVTFDRVLTKYYPTVHLGTYMVYIHKVDPISLFLHLTTGMESFILSKDTEIAIEILKSRDSSKFVYARDRATKGANFVHFMTCFQYGIEDYFPEGDCNPNGNYNNFYFPLSTLGNELCIAAAVQYLLEALTGNRSSDSVVLDDSSSEKEVHTINDVFFSIGLAMTEVQHNPSKKWSRDPNIQTSNREANRDYLLRLLGTAESL